MVSVTVNLTHFSAWVLASAAVAACSTATRVFEPAPRAGELGVEGFERGNTGLDPGLTGGGVPAGLGGGVHPGDPLGRTDFLYVADSKLCSRDAMGHIAGKGGRFVTILPRSRAEDGAFGDYLQTHTPVWTEAARRPGTRLGDPDEVYSTTPAAAPSAEAYWCVHCNDWDD